MTGRVGRKTYGRKLIYEQPSRKKLYATSQ